MKKKLVKSIFTILFFTLSIAAFSKEKLKKIDENLKPFSNIKSETKAIELNFLEGEKFKVDGKVSNKTSVYVKNNSLVIMQKDTKVEKAKVDINKNHEVLNVYIPKGVHLSDVEVDNKVGFVSFSGLNIGELELKLYAGNTSMENIISEEMEIDTKTGDLFADNIRAYKIKIENNVGTSNIKNSITKKLKIDSDVGMVFYEGIAKDVELKTKVGSVKLDLIGELEDYDFLIKKGLGGIIINNESYNKSLKIKNNKGNKIKGEIGIGELNINFK